MQAITYTAPNELSLLDLAVPVLQEHWVLVEVEAVGICGSDLLIWHGGLSRVQAPVIMGHEFSGTVVDANNSSRTHNGERVVVEPLINCEKCAACLRGDYNICENLGLLGIDYPGALAKYVAVPEHRLHPIPDHLDLKHAALAEPTAVACHMVSKSGLIAGNRVLIQGGGPIGALVASVARAHGVSDLLISEPNADRRMVLEACGFATVNPMELSPEDWKARAGSGFDTIFELTGIGSVLDASINLCRAQGTILLGGLPHGPVSVATANAVLKELNLVGSRVYRSEDFTEAIELLASGQVDAAKLITSEVSLAHGIDAGFERLQKSPDEMKIIITPGKEETV